MFAISDETLDVAALRSKLDRPRAGAFVAFEGRVRSENGGHDVRSLEYEAAEDLAVAEGEAILREARDRFALLDVAAVHRVGHLAIGDVAVWVGVLAPHRDAAFEACRFIIDQLKTRVPIWKKEHYADGHASWIHHQPA